MRISSFTVVDGALGLNGKCFDRFIEGIPCTTFYPVVDIRSNWLVVTRRSNKFHTPSILEVVLVLRVVGRRTDCRFNPTLFNTIAVQMLLDAV